MRTYGSDAEAGVIYFLGILLLKMQLKRNLLSSARGPLGTLRYCKLRLRGARDSR
jgi:hypothetical protein